MEFDDALEGLTSNSTAFGHYRASVDITINSALLWCIGFPERFAAGVLPAASKLTVLTSTPVSQPAETGSTWTPICCSESHQSKK
jgi:hypothetical protein